jgi:hypothetical protein
VTRLLSTSGHVGANRTRSDGKCHKAWGDIKSVPVRVQELFRLGPLESGVSDPITGEMGWRGHGLSLCRGSQAI